MDTNSFMEIVFERFNSQITDEIFLFIENDRELLHQYLLLLENNNLKILNSNIAKLIKAKYGLTNLNLKNYSPKSKLIQSFEQFEL